MTLSFSHVFAFGYTWLINSFKIGIETENQEKKEKRKDGNRNE